MLGPGQVTVKVSELGDHRMEFLIALHELVEATLLHEKGVTDAQIDEFDIAYRARYGLDAPEPGFDKHAPYHMEHMVADRIERLMAEALNVNWSAYEQAQAAKYAEGR